MTDKSGRMMRDAHDMILRDQMRRRTCKHNPPRSLVGELGMLDTCSCGAVTFVLRQKGNDGSNRPGLRWDRWSSR